MSANGIPGINEKLGIGWDFFFRLQCVKKEKRQRNKEKKRKQKIDVYHGPCNQTDC